MRQTLFILANLMLLLCIYCLSEHVVRTDFEALAPLYLGGAVLCFGLYRMYVQKPSKMQWRILLVHAILLRTITWFSFPNLSDDIYRFIWDGHLWVLGENPFNHIPRYYIEQGLYADVLTPALFTQLNSPDYFTIYPPVAQFVFAVSVYFSSGDIYVAAFIIKGFLWLCELGILGLLPLILKRLSLPKAGALLYFLHPLPIIEVVGNAHFEGAMLFFFLLGFYALLRVGARSSWLYLSAGAWALAIASKLLPLLFLPFLLRRFSRSQWWRFHVMLGGVLLLCFFPLLSGAFIWGFANSLDLYFQKFEFNASVYYLLRAIGIGLSGYNLIAFIGPLLGLTAAIWIFRRALTESLSKESFSYRFLWLRCFEAIILYLLLAMTVHPWYLLFPLLLSTAVRMRFSFVWASLIPLTYINYSYEVYRENIYIVALEYGLVLGVWWWQRKLKSSIFLSCNTA